MAIYEVTLEDGSVYQVETTGETTTPPTGLQRLFHGVGQAYENVVNRPAAASRGFIQGLAPGGNNPLQGFLQGSNVPTSIPTFQDQALDAYYRNVAQHNQDQPPNFAQTLGGLLPSATGLAADVATNPINLLLGLVGSTAPVKRLGVMAAESKPGQAVGQFLTKERSLPRFPITTAQKAKVLQQIREGFLSAPKLSGEEFEVGLSKLEELHPDQRVDLGGVLNELKGAQQTNPGVTTLLNRGIKNNRMATFVRGLLEKETRGEPVPVTMQEAQAFKQALRDALRNKFNQFAPELTDAHLELNDAYHGVKAAQIEAFQEFQDISSAYSQQLSKFRILKPYFKSGKLNQSVLSNFMRDPEIQEMARQLLPDETLRQIGFYRGVNKAKTVAGWLAGLGLVKAGAAPLLRFLGVNLPTPSE